MPIKTAYKFKRLVDIYEAEYGPLEPSSRVLDVKELESFLYSGMITGYAVAKTGLMNATMEISILRANVLSNPCNWIVPSVSINT